MKAGVDEAGTRTGVSEAHELENADGQKRSGSRGFRTCKEQGEWVELCFMARAAEMGWNVCKPYGDSASWDVGIEQGGRLVRVQVKSTTFCRGRTYTCNLVGRGKKGYEADEVDFFAVYLVPVDLWYILPFAAASKKSVSLQFTPEKAGHKYQQYAEAWHLLSRQEGQGAGGAVRKSGGDDGNARRTGCP